MKIKLRTFFFFCLKFLFSSLSAEQAPSQHVLDIQCEIMLTSLVEQVDSHVKNGNSFEQIMQHLNAKDLAEVSDDPASLIKLSYELLLQGQNQQKVVGALVKHIEEKLKNVEAQKNGTSKYVKWAGGVIFITVLMYVICKALDRYLHRNDPARHDQEYEIYYHRHQRLQMRQVPDNFEQIVHRFGQDLGNIDFNRMSPFEQAMFRARCLRFHEGLEREVRAGRILDAGPHDMMIMDAGWRWCHGAIDRYAANPANGHAFLNNRDFGNWVRFIRDGR